MTGGNYVKHLKILGKLCFLWDQAVAVLAADAATLSERQDEDAALYDQASTAVGAQLPATELIIGFSSGLQSTRTAGSTVRKQLIESITAAYLTNSLFIADLVTVPDEPTTAKTVLEALIAEMTDDSKTFTTAASTGLVHFFETVWSPTGTFPQSGTPTYADGTYAILAIV